MPRAADSQTIARSSRASASSGDRAPSPQVLSPMIPWNFAPMLIQRPERWWRTPTSIARPAGWRVPGGAQVVWWSSDTTGVDCGGRRAVLGVRAATVPGAGFDDGLAGLLGFFVAPAGFGAGLSDDTAGS